MNFSAFFLSTLWVEAVVISLHCAELHGCSRRAGILNQNCMIWMILHAVLIRGFIYSTILLTSQVRTPDRFTDTSYPVVVRNAEFPKREVFELFAHSRSVFVILKPWGKGRCISLPFSSTDYRTRAVNELQFKATHCMYLNTQEFSFYHFLQS